MWEREDKDGGVRMSSMKKFAGRRGGERIQQRSDGGSPVLGVSRSSFLAAAGSPGTSPVPRRDAPDFCADRLAISFTCLNSTRAETGRHEKERAREREREKRGAQVFRGKSQPR
jgi:hypothetical protein